MDDELTPRTRLVTMLVVVVPIAVAATILAAWMGRLDTALFFVGVPCLMAFVIGILPGRTSAGAVFQVVTVALLLVSAFLHEGALCVLLVSPLVYGMAFTVYGLARLAEQADKRRYGLGALLVLVALEGATPGMRVSPQHEVDAERIVAADCADFEASLARGPRIDQEADRGWLLRVAQYPTPTTATGAGLDLGDTWELGMPAGTITTEVVERAERRIVFDVTADGARTTRWVTLQQGTLTWEQADEGCRADLSLSFVRDLDPAFWFGPLAELFMGAGAEAFLASLD
ncbi:hypothetical protein [Nocardioides piscis]|uniref:Uncharacterized protein n=1 Tax=Nocardioides piscis TaxID=2714938 RepID=A0A6G7YE81_9ACTN|nr:hypothetical protein [Nocardioides piscis]QIK75103.1 hypothetical protein G7071_06335 [Nocardioides piscis]